MSTISYIQLGPGYEPLFTSSRAELLTDLEAVAQAIQTRLLLFQGEWWESLLDGLPLFQQILGRPVGRKQQVVDLLIQQRIQGTPYVLPGGVSNIQSSYDPATRGFRFTCDVATQFGPVTITNVPAPPKQGVLDAL